MEPIKIPSSGSSFVVDEPQIKTGKALIFLPGMSGGALTDRFRPLVDAALSAGFSVARINAWENGKDVARKNLQDIEGDIEYVIDHLRKDGHSSICAAGKSFGGTVLLALAPSIKDIEKRVLWAPVIGISEQGSNVETYMSSPLESLNTLQDLHVDSAFLGSVRTPTLIVHGDKDENIPISNSEKLVTVLPGAELFTVEGADHSFSGKEQEEILIRKTIEFLGR